jgi:hypothetical protein
MTNYYEKSLARREKTPIWEQLKFQTFHTPGTSGVDAFAFNLAGENNWLVPPLNLVNRVIKHCLACGAFGTLVVPKWESSPFWPVIFHSNSSCMHYISDVLECLITLFTRFKGGTSQLFSPAQLNAKASTPEVPGV